MEQGPRRLCRGDVGVGYAVKSLCVGAVFVHIRTGLDSVVDKFLYRQSYDAKVRAGGLCTELVDYLRLLIV